MRRRCLRLLETGSVGVTTGDAGVLFGPEDPTAIWLRQHVVFAAPHNTSAWPINLRDIPLPAPGERKHQVQAWSFDPQETP